MTGIEMAKMMDQSWQALIDKKKKSNKEKARRLNTKYF
jgi:hypothetical protein